MWRNLTAMALSGIDMAIWFAVSRILDRVPALSKPVITVSVSIGLLLLIGLFVAFFIVNWWGLGVLEWVGGDHAA